MHKFPKLNRVTVLVLLGALCLGFGIGMETISKWGPWMDLVSIYIIPIGATLGAVSWFYVMKKDALLDAINTGSTKNAAISGTMRAGMCTSLWRSFSAAWPCSCMLLSDTHRKFPRI